MSTTPSGRGQSLWTVREYADYLKHSPRWLWSANLRNRPGAIHVRLGASCAFFLTTLPPRLAPMPAGGDLRRMERR